MTLLFVVPGGKRLLKLLSAVDRTALGSLAHPQFARHAGGHSETTCGGIVVAVLVRGDCVSI